MPTRPRWWVASTCGVVVGRAVSKPGRYWVGVWPVRSRKAALNAESEEYPNTRECRANAVLGSRLRLRHEWSVFVDRIGVKGPLFHYVDGFNVDDGVRRFHQHRPHDSIDDYAAVRFDGEIEVEVVPGRAMYTRNQLLNEQDRILDDLTHPRRTRCGEPREVLTSPRTWLNALVDATLIVRSWGRRKRDATPVLRVGSHRSDRIQPVRTSGPRRRSTDRR